MRMQIKKILGVLLAVCFLMSVTAAAVSAAGSDVPNVARTHTQGTMTIPNNGQSGNKNNVGKPDNNVGKPGIKNNGGRPDNNVGQPGNKGNYGKGNYGKGNYGKGTMARGTTATGTTATGTTAIIKKVTGCIKRQGTTKIDTTNPIGILMTNIGNGTNKTVWTTTIN